MRSIIPRFTQVVVVAFLMSVPLHAARAQAPLYFWGQNFGSGSADGGQRVVVDSSGNIIVVGYFSGTIDLGGGGLTSAGGTDIFVARYNANGDYIWGKRFGGTGNDEAYGIAVDPTDDIFICGSFSATVDFGGTGHTSVGSTDIFVAKYAPNGVYLWSKSFGSTGPDLAKTISANAAGEVVFTGYSSGSINLGGGVVSGGTPFDIVLVKMSSSGAHLWSKLINWNNEEGEGATFDSQGNIYLIGYFTSQIDLGGGPMTGYGQRDGFLAKYAGDGTYQWGRPLGGNGDDIAVGVATDASGNVFVTGLFTLTANFGGDDFTTPGDRDIFTAKYDPNGVYQWSQQTGSSSDDITFSAAVDDSGNVFVSGGEDADIALVEYSVDGIKRWEQIFGPGYAFGIITGASGAVVAAGELTGPSDFGGGVINNIGASDVFLVKYGAGVDEDPSITSIVDVGNDQGRQVKIAFQPSGYDSPGSPHAIVQYEAFRRDDALPTAAPIAGSPPRISDASTATNWVFVAAVPAHGEPDYKMIAPTAADSTILKGPYDTTFFVRAATADPFVYYDSAPDSGYSLDNLAPAAPANLVYSQGALSWHESKDADFDYFTIYGSASGVLDGSATLIDYTIGTSLDVTTSPFVYYYVTATDFSGNEGLPARVNTLSGTNGTPQSYALGVVAYPNPFNPNTTIRYTVPSAGRVSVSIYDVQGARVIDLVDTRRDAGSYAVPWHGVDARGAPVASGTYFVKIRFAGESRTTKIVLLK